VRYAFLVETYATERLKVLSTWATFRDQDLPVRPHPTDSRGRSVLEHMVHQCVSENLWFRDMLGIDVGAPPLPQPETRLEFIRLGGNRRLAFSTCLGAEPGSSFAGSRTQHITVVSRSSCCACSAGVCTARMVPRPTREG
jgi:hypothetical protein